MNLFKTALKIFLFMTLLTGLIYPLLTTLIVHFTMPKQAYGSLIQKGDQILGSIWIAQNTIDNRYFWPRPSAIDYDPIHPSGGSNLGPTSQKLKDIIEERKQRVGQNAPPELLYASGSGLDPHISLETAYFQVERVAKARSIDPNELKNFIRAFVEKKELALLGAHYINVLLLNYALDEQDGSK